MKVQIRRSVFETNSSSVHSLTICSKEEFQDWKDGKVFFNIHSEDFTPVTSENEHIGSECPECENYWEECCCTGNRTFDELRYVDFIHKEVGDHVAISLYCEG